MSGEQALDEAPPGSRTPHQVLAVDDDPEVLALAVRSLELGGYSVVGVSSGRLAIVEARARTGLTALFSDVVMPGLTGLELASLLIRERPALPVLLTTGSPDPELRAEVAAAGHPLLDKPYAPGALLAAMADLLASPVDRTTVDVEGSR